jgi:hypothetical protein
LDCSKSRSKKVGWRKEVAIPIARQVDLARSSAWVQLGRTIFFVPDPLGMSRIRHCVECPNCRTRYLLSFRRFGNGSYLVSMLIGSVEEYALYCSCIGAGVVRWKSRETKAYQVSKQAYDRGYGSPDEISLMNRDFKDHRALGVGGYLGRLSSMGPRKQSA